MGTPQKGCAFHDAVQAAPDRRARQAQDAGDAVLREPDLESQIDDMAFRPFAQGAQGGEDFRGDGVGGIVRKRGDARAAPGGPRVRSGAGVEEVESGVLARRIVHAAAAEVVATVVDGDAVQPGRYRTFPREAAPAARRLDEDIVREVIRVGAVLYISPTDPPYEFMVARIEFPEAFPHHACPVIQSVRAVSRLRSVRLSCKRDHVRIPLQRPCPRVHAAVRGQILPYGAFFDIPA